MTVLQCRLQQKSTPQTNSKAIPLHQQQISARLHSSTQKAEPIDVGGTQVESTSVAAEGTQDGQHKNPETPGMVKNTGVAVDFSQDGQLNNRETPGVGSLSAMELQRPGVAPGSPAAAAPGDPAEAAGQTSGSEASPIAAAAPAAQAAVASGSHDAAAAAAEVCT